MKIAKKLKKKANEERPLGNQHTACVAVTGLKEATTVSACSHRVNTVFIHAHINDQTLLALLYSG